MVLELFADQYAYHIAITVWSCVGPSLMGMCSMLPRLPSLTVHASALISWVCPGNVQALIGNSGWSSRSSTGPQLYHVGTVPNAKGNIHGMSYPSALSSSHSKVLGAPLLHPIFPM